MRFDECTASAERAQRQTWVMLSGGAGRVLIFKHQNDGSASYTLSILPDANVRRNWPLGVTDPVSGVPPEHVIQTYPGLSSIERVKALITSLGFTDVIAGDSWILDTVSQL